MACQHFRKVIEFYEKLGYPRPVVGGFASLTEDDVRSITVMLREEVRETIDAAEKRDNNLFLDGLADLIFVAMGAFHKLGANYDVVMRRVCDSNLTKTPARTSRLDRDAVKGPNFVPANILEIPREELYLTVDDDAATIDADVPRAFVEAIAILKTKSQDYNTGVTRAEYNPFGIQSYAHNVIEKAMRVKSLVGSGKAPNHESLRDSFIDIINYAAFAVEFIDDDAAGREDVPNVGTIKL